MIQLPAGSEGHINWVDAEVVLVVAETERGKLLNKADPRLGSVCIVRLQVKSADGSSLKFAGGDLILLYSHKLER